MPGFSGGILTNMCYLHLIVSRHYKPEIRALLRLMQERQPRAARPEALATEFLIVLD